MNQVSFLLESSVTVFIFAKSTKIEFVYNMYVLEEVFNIFYFIDEKSSSKILMV